MEVYLTNGTFDSDESTNTTFYINLDGNSTSFSAALDAGLYDSIDNILGSVLPGSSLHT